MGSAQKRGIDGDPKNSSGAQENGDSSQGSSRSIQETEQRLKYRRFARGVLGVEWERCKATGHPEAGSSVALAQLVAALSEVTDDSAVAVSSERAVPTDNLQK